VLATTVTAIVWVNPMKFDMQSRFALFIGVLAFAFLVSHQLHLRSEAIRAGTAPVTSAPAAAASGTASAPSPTIEQKAADSVCSNVVAGKDAKIDCSTEQENGSAKKHPKSP
jgi:hypothetical protein